MSTPTEPSHSRAFEQSSTELRAPAWLLTLSACGAHLLFIGGAFLLSAPNHTLAAKPVERQFFEVELPASKAAEPEPVREVEPTPPPPPPEPVKIKAAKAPAPVPAAPEPEPEKPAPAEPEPPAPAAAQAGQALTQTEAAPANAPADSVVTGQGAGYAGGTTERGGTSQKAVAATSARAFGVEGGTGTAAPDRSRGVQLAAGLRWNCTTPDEAIEEGIERATVGLMIEVDVDGKVVGIEVKDDPGYGFAREARRCAMQKQWLSALDRNGQPRRAKQLVTLRFE